MPSISNKANFAYHFEPNEELPEFLEWSKSKENFIVDSDLLLSEYTRRRMLTEGRRLDGVLYEDDIAMTWVLEDEAADIDDGFIGSIPALVDTDEFNSDFTIPITI